MINWYRIIVWTAAITLCLAVWGFVIWALVHANFMALLGAISAGAIFGLADFAGFCFCAFARQGREA
jgi:hypothetical protein